MKKNTALISFIAVLTLAILSVVSAQASMTTGYFTISGLITSGIQTEFNGVELGNGIMAGMVGDTVPVRVIFTAQNTTEDVRVEVSMNGFRDDVSARTSRFDIVRGSTYTKLLNLDLPTDEKKTDKEYTLYVEISSATEKFTKEYTIRMQRNSYTIDVLSVDYSADASAGKIVPITVVVKNTGFNRADDVYVVASIPALGVSTRGYLGDIVPIDDQTSGDDNEEDSVEETVYLRIPSNAQGGVYDLKIEVYNLDSKTELSKKISVGTSAEGAKAYATIKNQNIKAGESATYELVLVNMEDSVKVYNLEATSGKVMTVSVPSVVTVGPQSSKTVEVRVSVPADASEGSYTFTVNVDGEEVVFEANIEGKSVSTSVVALTVILIVIFVVLLAVLVVLLTRKEKPIEEVETSYY